MTLLCSSPDCSPIVFVGYRGRTASLPVDPSSGRTRRRIIFLSPPPAQERGDYQGSYSGGKAISPISHED